MSEELKPVRCGCGGEAEPYAWVYGSYSVHCLSCGIETVNCKTPEEAIRTWNRAMGAKDINVPRKGKWLWDEEEDRCYCSECGEEDDLSIDGVYMMHDFCPNCGADMRGDR